MVSEGLLIADSAHDLGLSTYVPREALSEQGNCAFACAFIFFYGLERKIDGQFGVRQFYSEKDGGKHDSGSEENTQFTVSEIIGFLNNMEHPLGFMSECLNEKKCIISRPMKREC